MLVHPPHHLPSLSFSLSPGLFRVSNQYSSKEGSYKSLGTIAGTGDSAERPDWVSFVQNLSRFIRNSSSFVQYSVGETRLGQEATEMPRHEISAKIIIPAAVARSVINHGTVTELPQPVLHTAGSSQHPRLSSAGPHSADILQYPADILQYPSQYLQVLLLRYHQTWLQALPRRCQRKANEAQK